MLVCTPGCAVKGGIIGDAELEGSHVGLARPSGMYVEALALGGCDTPVVGLEFPVLVLRRDVAALVLGLVTDG